MPATATQPLLPQAWRIRRKQRDTHDCFTLELEGDCPFEPGQFNMLYHHGVGEVAISISGDPHRLGTLVHTIRAVGSVTHALSSLKRGATIGVRGPFGSPWPLQHAVGRDLILIAGGIGLAPLRPVLYEVARRRNDFGKVVLLVGARSPDDILYRAELQRWASLGSFDVDVTVDHAVGPWPGHVGVVTTRLPAARFDAARATAFLCGPEVMIRFAAQGLLQRGLEISQIYVSLERNMKCAVGFCGHCQFGPKFVCKDGPVFPYPDVKHLLEVREL